MALNVAAEEKAVLMAAKNKARVFTNNDMVHIAGLATILPNSNRFLHVHFPMHMGHMSRCDMA